MDNKKKKLIISIIAGVLALAVIVAAILLTLSQCQGGSSKKEPPKKVVIVAGNNKNPDDNNDDNGDDQDPTDSDPFVSDDITLDLGYTDMTEYETHELMGSDSEAYLITSANGSDPLCKTFRGVTSTIYHPSEYLSRDPHERKYTPEMLDLELTRMKNSGIKFVRTMFWSDWMWTGDENNPWNTETQTMLEFYEWCKKVEEYGMQVAPMMMWSYAALFYGGSEYLVECDYMYPYVYNEDGSVWNMTEYEYEFDEEGNLLYQSASTDGVLAWENIYESDDEGWNYLAKEITYDENGELVSEISYDAYGNEVE